MALSYTTAFREGAFAVGQGYKACFELSDKRYALLVTDELLEELAPADPKSALEKFGQALLLTAEGKVDAGYAQPGDSTEYVILRERDADRVRKHAQ